ncbi:sirohydrochlorin chelatase [Cohnella zeiphila]|uniref:Cobalamin biosynthesis protein CbiX n=1 Tax=Cohnella zeiphila TaxID=2761120 RepID=A0A7X0SQB4_9BACL|nr:CbiX/SirB N-terminal domain-containing protein [Cohnella zeiphila]MBB6734021.1 cobalamin biosynthesis protein CbiX [Cohnella zeiphila]
MKPGVLVIGHGSRDERWVERVEETVRGVRKSLPGVPVACGYLELVDGRLIQDGIDRLEAEGVTDLLAIPLFVSEGSTHVDEIGWALGAYAEPRRPTDLERYRVESRLTYGRPIGDDPEIVDALLDKLAASGLSEEPAREGLLLIGHGSEEAWFYEKWRSGLEGLAARMKQRGGFADATAALLRPDEAADRVRAMRSGSGTELRVLAVPVFVSEGYFTSEVIPKRLAGLGCRYAEGALIPHPKVADWVVRQAKEWLAKLRAECKEGEQVGEN